MSQEVPRQSIKLPYSVLGVLWAILAAVVNVWWTGTKAAEDQRNASTAQAKDIGYLSNTVEKIEKRMEADRRSNYRSEDAARDLQKTNEMLSDHEGRLRVLESRRSK